jgi:hypothetical protein
MFILIQFTYHLIRAIKQVHNSISQELNSLRQWLDAVEIQNATIAHLICQIVPTQCPFARDISLFGRTIFSIPPLCKINPFYEEIVSLRFRALCYLADGCQEDISRYC